MRFKQTSRVVILTWALLAIFVVAFGFLRAGEEGEEHEGEHESPTQSHSEHGH